MLQSPMLFIVILVVLVLIALMTIYRRNKTKPNPECRHCHSTDTKEIRRDPIGTRTVEIVGGGAMAGGDVRLQLDYEVTYHCNNCHRDSVFKITETH